MEDNSPYVGEEDVDTGYFPIDYNFDYDVNCDTLSIEELETMYEETDVLNLEIDVRDSINISYDLASDAYNFFEGYYKLENDTIFIWETTGSWEDLDSYCIYHLSYTVPKPSTEIIVIKVNEEIREIDLLF